jgi:peptide/nickel transport system ATP-binding protein
MTEHRVIVDALNIDYPAARVVNNLSFTLGNERLALVGESGSGKSMSARALMGLVRKPGIVSANRLNVLGNDLLTLNARRWQALRGNGIAMVLQDPRYALNPVKSVAAQLDEALTLHQRLPRRACGAHSRHHPRRRAERTCASRYPGELSGGMGQRVMIAIALINNPQVLIADEPTSALDARLRNQILELLVQQCEERQMAMLLISHDLPLVAEHCDRVLVMYQGEKVDEMAASRLPQATHPYTRTLWTCRPDAHTLGRCCRRSTVRSRGRRPIMALVEVNQVQVTFGEKRRCPPPALASRKAKPSA